VVYLMSRHVLPTAPSPTTTHFMFSMPLIYPRIVRDVGGGSVLG
jgi:hypothetical protein